MRYIPNQYSYTPPSGTKQVILNFHLNMSMEQGSSTNEDNNRGLILIRMLIDGTSVDSQIQAWGDEVNYGEIFTFKGIIDITGTDRAYDGKLSFMDIK